MKVKFNYFAKRINARAYFKIITSKKSQISIVKVVLILCLLMPVFFVSCIVTKNFGVYDTSLPANQQCTLRFNSSVRIGSFNGKRVSWCNQGGFDSSNSFIVTIPPGKHTFSGSFVSGMYQITFHNVTFDFEAGKVYEMYVYNPKDRRQESSVRVRPYEK